MLQRLKLDRIKMEGMSLIKSLTLIPNEMLSRYKEIRRERECLQELEDSMFNNL